MRALHNRVRAIGVREGESSVYLGGSTFLQLDMRSGVGCGRMNVYSAQERAVVTARLYSPTTDSGNMEDSCYNDTVCYQRFCC